jgi:hypothetical protein
VSATATVGAASTMKASAPMGAASTVKAFAAMKALSAVEPATFMSTMIEAAAEAFAIASPSEVSAVIEVVTTVKAVEPRARAEKYAAREITRSIVAVRRAGVRIIPVITILANWRRPNVCWAAPYTDHDSLCMRVRHCN